MGAPRIEQGHAGYEPEALPLYYAPFPNFILPPLGDKYNRPFELRSFPTYDKHSHPKYFIKTFIIQPGMIMCV